MGMPKIECTNIDKCCAASSLLQSIALEETALSHILNAEGEKLQKAINLPNTCIDDLIAINNSVANTIEKVTALELVLKGKLELLLPLVEKCEKHPPKPPCISEPR